MARSFSGATDRVNCGNVTLPSILSVCFWVKAPSANADNVVLCVTDRLVVNFLFGVDLNFDLDHVGSVAGKWTSFAAQHAMTLANWNHVAVVHDSTSTANDPVLYVNGVVKPMTDQVAATQPIQSAAATLRIGNFQNDALSVGGSLHGVEIHSAALTPSEVLEAMQRYAPRARLAHFRLGGGSPETDLSGNGLVGTVTGTTVVAGPSTSPQFLGVPVRPARALVAGDQTLDVAPASSYVDPPGVNPTTPADFNYLRGVALAGGSFGSDTVAAAAPGTYGANWFYEVDGGGRTSTASFSYLAGRGVRLVRIDFRWERLQPTLGGALNSAEVTRITAMLNACAANGLVAILECHNYGHFKFTTSDPLPASILGGFTLGHHTLTYAHLANLWTRIVTQWGAHAGLWGYELMNEPVAIATAVIANHTHYDFEVSAGLWDGGSTRSTTFAYSGNASLRWAPGTGVATLFDGIDNGNISAHGPVVSAWVYVPVGNAGTHNLAISVQRADFGVDTGSFVTVTPGVWTLISYSPPAPTLADANQVGLTISGAGRSAGEFIYVDDYQQGDAATPVTGVDHWKAASQAAVTAIRSQETTEGIAAVDKNVILVGGYNWSKVQGWVATNGAGTWITDPLADPAKLVYVGHHYWDAGEDSSYGSDTPTSVYGSLGAAQTAVVAQLQEFTNWLAANSVHGAVTEVGWPRVTASLNQAGADAWNAVAESWFDQADAAELHVTTWAAGSPWDYTSSGYELLNYGASTSSWGAGAQVDHAYNQASIIEAHPSEVGQSDQLDLAPATSYAEPAGVDPAGAGDVALDVEPANSYALPPGVEVVDTGAFFDLTPATSYADPAGVELVVSGDATLDLQPATSYAEPPGVNVSTPQAAEPRRPGGPLPWMVFGGVEVGNAARTMAYLGNPYDPGANPAGIVGIPSGAYGWRLGAGDCCSCPVLETDGAGIPVTFLRPDDIGVSSGDPAPWYDPGVPESAQFLGVLITQITGLDSTVGRAKVERAAGLGGAALGAQRAAGREIGVRAVLVATSCPGLDYGRRWLSHALANDLCSDCESYQLELRTTCPPGDRPDVGLVNLYEVGLSEGPKVVRDGGPPGCCDLLEVEWTLTAGNPLVYACPVEVVPTTLMADVGGIVSATIDPPEPFGTIAAQIEVQTGTVAGQGILVRAWDQLLGDPCPGADGAECLSIRLAGLPDGVRVTIDGARQRLVLSDASGVESDGLPYVVMSDGQAFSWPEFVGCQRVCVAVSVFADPGPGAPVGASVAIASQHRFLA